ncbi:MAG: hypothetical protein HY664_07555, partial [Chloroflexi bacterium]|nr:hypothetical protein [Chloroflexota bacterium]
FATAGQQRQEGHEVTIVLLHDAVLSNLSWEGEMMACREDVLARDGNTRAKTVGYEEVVYAIFAHDKVVSW